MESVFEKIIEKLEELNPIDYEESNAVRKCLSDVKEIVKQAAADYSNGWIPVECGEADTEPVKDCEIWVTRKNCFGDVWVQKCPYYVGDGFWDGVIAWKPLEEKPEPYQSKGE